jgi:cbb3-type cytochrome oxidase maturation protein
LEILYLLIPIALVILVVAIKLLFWAINSGQYDDLDTEAQRIFFDDDNPVASKKLTLKKRETPSGD